MAIRLCIYLVQLVSATALHLDQNVPRSIWSTVNPWIYAVITPRAPRTTAVLRVWSEKAGSKMPSDSINVLRAVGAAADLPAFLQLVNSKACGDILRSIDDDDDFKRLQRQGYSALVLAALSKGLRLYSINAAAARQHDRSPSSAVSQDLQQVVDWVGYLSMSVITILTRISVHWGEGSREAKNMEQELLDSGAHEGCRIVPGIPRC
jgi:hypothetical protein